MWRKASYLRSASFAAISTLPVIFGCAQANAAPLDFDFTFAGGRATVMGVIEGLSNNSTGPASAVTIDSITPGTGTQLIFSVPQNTTASPLWNVSANDFTVSNGQITAADFNSTSTGTTRLCFSTSNECPFANPGSLASMAFLSDSRGVFVSGTPTFSVIPLPAALPLFGTGLGALGLIGWRRKRKAHVSLLGAA